MFPEKPSLIPFYDLNCIIEASNGNIECILNPNKLNLSYGSNNRMNNNHTAQIMLIYILLEHTEVVIKLLTENCSPESSSNKSMMLYGYIVGWTSM